MFIVEARVQHGDTVEFCFFLALELVLIFLVTHVAEKLQNELFRIQLSPLSTTGHQRLMFMDPGHLLVRRASIAAELLIQRVGFLAGIYVPSRLGAVRPYWH